MPPAIHRTMTVSAVGSIFSSGSAAQSFGAPADRAASVAAEAVLRKSRRVQEFLFIVRPCSLNELKFRKHRDGPEEIADAIFGHGALKHLVADIHLALGGLAAQGVV